MKFPSRFTDIGAISPGFEYIARTRGSWIAHLAGFVVSNELEFLRSCVNERTRASRIILHVQATQTRVTHDEARNLTKILGQRDYLFGTACSNGQPETTPRYNESIRSALRRCRSTLLLKILDEIHRRKTQFPNDRPC